MHLHLLEGDYRISIEGGLDCTKVLGGISKCPLFIQHSEIALKRILRKCLSSPETVTLCRNREHFCECRTLFLAALCSRMLHTCEPQEALKDGR